MSLIDRVSSYRLLSALAGLALFCAGVWFLGRAGLSEGVLLLYGLVFLVPYMVATTAACSNYAPAIGLGCLLAAASLTVVLASSLRWRSAAVVLLVAGSWIGIPVWPDFIFVALGATLAAAAWCIDQTIDPRSGRTGEILRWTAGAALIALLMATALRLTRLKIANIGTRMPAEIPAWGSRDFNRMIFTVATPFLLAVAAAGGILLLGGKGLPAMRRVLRRISFGLAALLVVGFLLTPYTTVPYESTRLNFGELVHMHNLSFWSNNFSWDQDNLFWKFYWGAFGWHDVFYPDWLYALARWSCVGLFIALPLLCARFAAERPRTSALLLLISGIAISLCIVTEILRYLQPTNPWGRFLLPYLPLAALPVLVLAEPSTRRSVLRALVLLAVGLQVWTSVFVLGSRYTLGQ